MGLFSKETAEEKRERKIQESLAKEEARKQALIKKYHLEELVKSNPADIELVARISADLAGNGLIKFGTTLSSKAEDVAKITYLSALIEQNWIIINQLARLNNNIESMQKGE